MTAWASTKLGRLTLPTSLCLPLLPLHPPAAFGSLCSDLSLWMSVVDCLTLPVGRGGDPGASLSLSLCLWPWVATSMSYFSPSSLPPTLPSLISLSDLLLCWGHEGGGNHVHRESMKDSTIKPFLIWNILNLLSLSIARIWTSANSAWNVTALKLERHTPPQAEGAALFIHHCF